MKIELTDTERNILWQAGDHHPASCDCTGHAVDIAYAPNQGETCDGWDDTCLVIESIVASRVAGALRDAADAVKQVRESGILPPGVHSHPTSEHFESWLRALAADNDE